MKNKDCEKEAKHKSEIGQLQEEIENCKRLLRSDGMINYKSASLSEAVFTLGSDKNPY
jgi:hypothetical protein